MYSMSQKWDAQGQTDWRYTETRHAIVRDTHDIVVLQQHVRWLCCATLDYTQHKTCLRVFSWQTSQDDPVQCLRYFKK